VEQSPIPPKLLTDFVDWIEIVEKYIKAQKNYIYEGRTK